MKRGKRNLREWTAVVYWLYAGCKGLGVYAKSSSRLDCGADLEEAVEVVNLPNRHHDQQNRLKHSPIDHSRIRAVVY